MDFDEYQRQALETDQTKFENDIKDEIFPLLGIVDETGSLITEYKKYLVDGDYYRIYKDRLVEEIGDILWYIANFSSKVEIGLSDVAAANLAKVNARWPKDEKEGFELFDEEFPEDQRLPREFEVKLVPEKQEDGSEVVRMYLEGQEVGDPLTDNAYHNDGYRYHDVFHWAYVAQLGWSPVIRKLLSRKRKKDPKKDEVEDGARARIIEEAISAMVFNSAENYAFFRHGGTVESGLLRSIKALTNNLEVAKRELADWEKAILSGFEVWDLVVKNNGGVVVGNIYDRTFFFKGPI